MIEKMFIVYAPATKWHYARRADALARLAYAHYFKLIASSHQR